MPKDKCQACGKPCVGRYCWTHIVEELFREQRLYLTDPDEWRRQVVAANPDTPYQEPTP